MRDGRDVKHRIRLGQRVIASVIAERPFVAQRFGRVNVTFDDEIGVGGDFEVIGLALHEFDGFFAEITGEEEFIQSVRHRRGGGEGKHRVAADENGDGHALALLIITTAMACGDFLELPVHAGGFVVVNLDAIHAEIALARVRVARDDARQRDETSAVQRPAAQNWQVGQGWRLQVEGCRLINVRRFRPTFNFQLGTFNQVNHIFARTAFHGFRFCVAQIQRKR